MKNHLSIVIPVKNSEETLPRCLESINDPNAFLKEIIVVDDGSTDSSINLAQSYPQVKVIQSPRHSRGVARARNFGAHAAGGAIILFIDSDIILKPDALGLIEQQFKDPTVQALVGLLDPESAYRNFASDYKNLWIHYTYRVLPLRTSLFYTSIAAIRRDLFLEVGGFDEVYRKPGLEDTAFGNKLYDLGYSVNLVPELLALHLKYYQLKDIYKLDYARAMALVKIQLRKGWSGLRSGNRSSVPRSFIVSIATFVICLISGLIGGLTGQVLFFLISALTGVLSLILNFDFLTFIYRARGCVFVLASILFLFSDSVVLAVGTGAAFIDYLKGKRY